MGIYNTDPVGRAVGELGVIEHVDDGTTWKELQECIALHLRLASQCCIPKIPPRK